MTRRLVLVRHYEVHQTQAKAQRSFITQITLKNKGSGRKKKKTTALRRGNNENAVQTAEIGRKRYQGGM